MIQSNLVRGDEIMLFVWSSANDQYISLGGATSHTLTISPEYTETQCKDSGIVGWRKLSKVGWEVSIESLFTEQYSYLFNSLMNETEIQVMFAIAGGSSNNRTVEDGLVDEDDYFFYDKETNKHYYSGTVKVSSLTLNAASGDNATYSCTLTGVGKLEEKNAPNLDI